MIVPLCDITFSSVCRTAHGQQEQHINHIYCTYMPCAFSKFVRTRIAAQLSRSISPGFEAPEPRRVAVFGGAFDPPTISHVHKSNHSALLSSTCSHISDIWPWTPIMAPGPTWGTQQRSQPSAVSLCVVDKISMSGLANQSNRTHYYLEFSAKY